MNTLSRVAVRICCLAVFSLCLALPAVAAVPLVDRPMNDSEGRFSIDIGEGTPSTVAGDGWSIAREVFEDTVGDSVSANPIFVSDVAVVPVPEPTTISLLASALLTVALIGWHMFRRRKALSLAEPEPLYDDE